METNSSKHELQQQYYKNKLESGLLYQDFVIDCCWSLLGLAVVTYSSKTYQQMVGESKTGVEIKHDEKYAKSTNLYMETAEKASIRGGAFVPSGIERADNTWLYVIGDYDTVFIFSKRFLQALKRSGKYGIFTIPMGTSQGFLLPHDDAEKYAAQILYPNAEKKLGKQTRDLHSCGRDLHEAVIQAGKG